MQLQIKQFGVYNITTNQFEKKDLIEELSSIFQSYYIKLI